MDVRKKKKDCAKIMESKKNEMIIALYLPQFHRVHENDEWWGEGFTDWISTKKAAPLFEGHYQPHVPLNNNMYDLMDKSVMEWQANLMHQYGVDGMCFYHYWFENGKQILEKPAENLLGWKDINMPFCFSWANETWARSWGNVRYSNVWSNAEEPQVHSGKAVLLNQNYGDENDWIAHFEYLLPFFKDSRYIKKDNKPIFLFYKTKLVDCLEKMLSCWRRLAIENGFDGLFIVGSNCAGNEGGLLDKELIAQPQSASRLLIDNNFSSVAKIISYDDVWNNILLSPERKKEIYGGFVGYDDTPRRGKEGVVIHGSTPEKFGNYLRKLIVKNRRVDNEFIFINAWNEWGEGMHLEPDERYGYSFLEQIAFVKENSYEENEQEEYYQIVQHNFEEVNTRANKFELYLNDLDLWMALREQKISIVDSLKKKGVSKIAIYGYGIMGRHLLEECKQSDIECSYIIDRQRDKIHTLIPVYSPNDELPTVDMIIVSAYFFYEDIKSCISSECISLGTLIHEVYNNIEFV